MPSSTVSVSSVVSGHSLRRPPILVGMSFSSSETSKVSLCGLLLTGLYQRLMQQRIRYGTGPSDHYRVANACQGGGACPSLVDWNRSGERFVALQSTVTILFMFSDLFYRAGLSVHCPRCGYSVVRDPPRTQQRCADCKHVAPGLWHWRPPVRLSSLRKCLQPLERS